MILQHFVVLLLSFKTVLSSLSESYSNDSQTSDGSWQGPDISEGEGDVEGDDAPRLSGNDPSPNMATMILPHPKDVLKRCVYYYPHSKHNRPPKNAPNSEYHFFFDLEDTIYTRRSVQIRKYEFLATFLQKEMRITDESEIKELLLKKKDRLNQMLEFKNVKIDDPYQFIVPDKAVTSLVSSMKASRWIFTKSNLYTKDHAMKVLKLMGIDQYFSGIIYSPSDLDYGKTQKAFFDLATLATGLDKPRHAFFIDDSALNVFMALNCKWNAVIFYNANYHKKLPKFYDSFHGQVHRIAEVRQIRQVFPQLFTDKSKSKK